MTKAKIDELNNTLESLLRAVRGSSSPMLASVIGGRRVQLDAFQMTVSNDVSLIRGNDADVC
jgi:hypothetical protein